MRYSVDENFYLGWDARKLFNPNSQRSMDEFGWSMTWLLHLLPLVVDHALLLDGGSGGGDHSQQDHAGDHGGPGGGRWALGGRRTTGHLQLRDRGRDRLVKPVQATLG